MEGDMDYFTFPPLGYKPSLPKRIVVKEQFNSECYNLVKNQICMETSMSP